MSGSTHNPDRDKMACLGRLADEVSILVLSDSYPEIDVVIAVENLREMATNLFPGCEGLYDMIYVSRFRRLWEQWRHCGAAPF
jgi:hypothetical protein